ncbi:hypothetical protein BCR34DRAFT_590942 [Clohesyomyces aquaticus]|uniref:PARP catalytic domain-containing protein n=1 Tax=Clohesyomyces aquaticus TaxID=1231657 RepID=A0A1Y1Z4R9_9PLEO|nr:hypothetical protein BCR34DRAFT_590942 [Clohesyomyces aquaticus]
MDVSVELPPTPTKLADVMIREDSAVEICLTPLRTQSCPNLADQSRRQETDTSGKASISEGTTEPSIPATTTADPIEPYPPQKGTLETSKTARHNTIRRLILRIPTPLSKFTGADYPGLSINFETLVSSPDVVDILLSLVFAAARDMHGEGEIRYVRQGKRWLGRRKCNLLPGLSLRKQDFRNLEDTFPAVQNLISKPPTTSSRNKNITATTTRTQSKDSIPPQLRPLTTKQTTLLEYILSPSLSNPFALTPHHIYLPSRPDSPIQVLLLPSSSRSHTFAHYLYRSKQHSVPLFHGTHPTRLPAILSKGLRNMSGTRYQSNGHAMGRGIYLAEDPGTSLCYSQGVPVWRGAGTSTSWATAVSGSGGNDDVPSPLPRPRPRIVLNAPSGYPQQQGTVRVLLGCEVVPTPREVKRKSKRGAYVVKNSSRVMVRMVFVGGEDLGSWWDGEELRGEMKKLFRGNVLDKELVTRTQRVGRNLYSTVEISKSLEKAHLKSVDEMLQTDHDGASRASRRAMNTSKRTSFGVINLRKVESTAYTTLGLHWFLVTASFLGSDVAFMDASLVCDGNETDASPKKRAWLDIQPSRSAAYASAARRLGVGRGRAVLPNWEAGINSTRWAPRAHPVEVADRSENEAEDDRNQITGSETLEKTVSIGPMKCVCPTTTDDEANRRRELSE